MKTLDNILLLGRPAAGKSEFIDCLKSKSDAERAEIFHIGRLEQLDDFVWIWEKFLEDNLWEESGYPRLYSHKEGNNYGLNEDCGKLFDLMLVKFNHIFMEKYNNDENNDFFNDGTVLMEFSRGGKRSYAHSLPRLDDEILKRSSILFVKVSFEESWRRNVARYEEKLKHSILAHMATRRVMDAFYSTDDWDKVSNGRERGYIEIRNIKIPFVTVSNEPEIKDPIQLAERYRPALDSLMKLTMDIRK